jgi:hypothetical protein
MMKKLKNDRQAVKDISNLEYGRSSVELLETWMHHMIRRGYFFVFVRLPDGSRAMHWLSIN